MDYCLIDEYYNNNFSIRKISVLTNNTYYKIYTYLKSKNILRDTKKHIIFSNYFKDINTNEKAYLLGFIAADGYIGKYNLEFHISKKDREILNYIKKVLNYSGDIKEKENSLKLTITNKELLNDLKKLIPSKNNKTKKLIFPNINQNFKNAFVLGYFDGDGCIYTSKTRSVVDIIGTKEFIEVLNEYLKENNIKGFIVNNKKCDYLLNYRIYKKEELQKFYEQIILSNTFSLERKKEKFYQLLITKKNN